MFIQFDKRADDFYSYAIFVATLPNRQWRTPIPLARKTPVAHVAQELAESAVFQVPRNPSNIFIVFQKFILYRRGFHPPCFSCIIKERRIASPAMRVFVRIRRLMKNLITQNLQNLFCRLFGFYIQSFQHSQANTFFKFSVLAYRMELRKSDFGTEAIVIFAVHHRSMDYTRTFGRGYEIRRVNLVRIF